MFFCLKHQSKNRVCSLIFTIFFIGAYNDSFAQDYGWWNTLVQWDGRSHWAEYMIYTPKYFGPNAIPVPDVKNGKIVSRTELGIGLATHFSQGDDAQNLTTRFYIPVTKDKIGLQIYLVPYERYTMTPETRDLRRSRDFDGKGHALGDVYIGTWIQLTKPTSSIDLLLTINLKTASGSNREATRYTDGSGYNFDLSLGRSYVRDGPLSNIRPHAQIGFYVWETNEDRNPQNDAFSYGGGIDFQFNKTVFTTQLAGFIGYKGNGDKPIMARINIVRDLSKRTSMKLGMQYGLKDSPYRSLFLSIIKAW